MGTAQKVKLVRMTKATSVTLMVLCLLALSAVCQQPIKAQNQSNISINNDGSVSPPSAPIQQTGNTYALTRNIGEAIEVHRSNVTLDGNGHTVSAGLLFGVVNVTVKNFDIRGGKEFQGVCGGIVLSSSSHVLVTNNTITGVSNFVLVFVYYEPVAGIVVAGGHSNIISGNNLVNNWQGMDFSDTSNNLIVGNNLASNWNDKTGYAEPGGIYFNGASNNTIYHNNFEIAAGGQAKDFYYDSVNVWDDGYPFGGNYWIDYQSKYYSAAEIDNSGIGNTSYVIDELLANSANNTDRYPLMRPFNNTFYALQSTPPKISIISPLNQTYNESSVYLTFSVNVLSPVKVVSWAGYSLDGEPNITVTSNSPMTNVTITNMTIGAHNVTVYANDTYGNIAISQAINFTIEKPETFPIVIVAVVSTATVIAVVGVFLYLRKRKG